MKFSAHHFLFLVSSVALLTACTPTIETHGNLISDAKFRQIAADISTRADVSRKWGPPTDVSTLDPNIWYYIGETTEQKGVFAPEVVKRRLVEVRFDENDTVKSVADIDPKQGKKIEPLEAKTPTAGKSYTVLQQFIGNLGRFNTKKSQK